LLQFDGKSALSSDFLAMRGLNQIDNFADNAPGGYNPRP
jgi:hypothetical protein